MMRQALAILFCCIVIEAARDADIVTDLPGLNYQVNFKQYSGYLKASDTQYLHYWFVESQNDPTNDPVVLWLNGGPGCSSMYGILMEHGPFLINDAGTELIENPYSWNTITNMLYLESPAGVGYSYSTGKISTSDDDTANQNYNALMDFFDGFSEYLGNEFYITGESYAGIYVPTLSQKVVDGDLSINFQGFAIGNGVTSFDMNDNSLVYFSYYHGLVGDKLWKDMTDACCTGDFGDPRNCHFSNPPNARCQAEVLNLAYIVWGSGINVYSMYTSCLNSSTYQSYEKDMSHMFKKIKDDDFKMKEGRSTAPCLDDSGEEIWLNNPDVRTALHIYPGAGTWTMCANIPYYTSYDTMNDQYQYLLGKGYKILVYSGDTDLSVNFLGDQWFISSLNLNQLERRKEWHYSGQVAGFVSQYEGLTHTTVSGVGHMVPQWAPARALVMFTNFIKNQQYS